MLANEKWFESKVVEESPLVRLFLVARQMVEREENWCQAYSEWRVDDNKPHLAICAVHAIQKAWEIVDQTRSDQMLSVASFQTLGRAVGVAGHGPDIGRWNDNHSHAEVLAAFDRAIAYARAEG